jgi:hypothetical protein
LEQLSAIYDYEERAGDDFFGPLHVAERIATENATIPFQTRYQAIAASLPSGRAAEVLDCLEQQVQRGTRTEEYLRGGLTEPSILWEPMGKYFCELFLKYGGHQEADARETFCTPLLKRHHVGNSSAIRNLEGVKLSSELNPRDLKFTEEQEGIILEVMGLHAERIRFFILENGLFEAQLAARTRAVSAGQYEHVPSIDYGVLGLCDSRAKESRSLTVTYVVRNWGVHLVIMKGEDQELDLKLADLQTAVDLRNSELTAYIANF